MRPRAGALKAPTPSCGAGADDGVPPTPGSKGNNGFWRLPRRLQASSIASCVYSSSWPPNAQHTSRSALVVHHTRRTPLCAKRNDMRRMPARLPGRTAAVLLLGAIALAACGPAFGLVDNVLTQWLNETRDIARTQKLTNGLAIAQYVYVSLAAHRALQKGGAPEDALVAFAAHTVNSARYPVIQFKFDKLLKKHLAGKSKEDVDKARSIAVPIANQVLAERIGDASTAWKDYEPNPPNTPYGYQFLPNQTFSLIPQLVDSTPYVWSAEGLRAFTTNKDPSKGLVFEPAKTYEDLVAVVDAGAKNSKTRTKYDTDTASFWAFGSGVGGGSNSISGAFLDIAEQVLPSNSSLKDTALAFSKLTTAMHDAYIACWQVKYRTNYWRPTTAIRQGFPGFTAIPDWEPLLPVPPFPEYPSGHQCTAGAALSILENTLGTDKVTFSVQSDDKPELGTRTYSSLKDAGYEAAVSRLYAGLHFPSANNDGQALGRAVGDHVFKSFLGSPADKGVQGGGGPSPPAPAPAPAPAVLTVQISKPQHNLGRRLAQLLARSAAR